MNKAAPPAQEAPPQNGKPVELIDLFTALGEGAKEPWVREEPDPEAQRAWNKPED